MSASLGTLMNQVNQDKKDIFRCSEIDSEAHIDFSIIVKRKCWGGGGVSADVRVCSVIVCICVCMGARQRWRGSFLACPHGSRCVNNTLIKMRINQSAEGAERHSPKPSLPLSLSHPDIDPSLSAHHQHPPGCSAHSPSSLVCRGAR